MRRFVQLRPALLLPVLPVLVLAGLLGKEIAWRLDHALLKPQAPSADAAWVAEVRALPDTPGLPREATGVFVRGQWAWLRSLGPRLVFAGACDNVDTRWMAPRRLVIECELRADEPRLLQDRVGDVVIELVVQRRFALAGARAAAFTRPRSCGS